MGARKATDRKPVHFRVRSHADQSSYLRRPIRRSTRTFVQERFVGTPGTSIGKKIDLTEPQLDELTNERRRTMRREYERFLGRGGEIQIGEQYYTNSEKKRFRNLEKRVRQAETAMFGFPELGKMQEYFHSMAEFFGFRHWLARRTIKRLLKEGKAPIEVQYAQPHDLLIEELRREGVEVSSEIEPKSVWIDTEITARLMKGEKLTPLDYKRGYVCMLDYNNKGMLKAITGKERHSEVTKSQYAFYKRLQRALMDRLSEKQLDRIINAQNPRLLFTMNDLPENPSRSALK